MNPLPAILDVISIILQLIVFLLFAQVIVSWLIAFNVISTRSSGVRQLLDMLDRITAPILRPIRRILPDFGGLDFSPFVAWLIIYIVQHHVIDPLAVSAYAA